MENHIQNRKDNPKNIYVTVILPLKYSGEATYFLPDKKYNQSELIGTWVLVNFAGKEYSAIIKDFYYNDINQSIEDKNSLEEDKKKKNIIYKEIIDFLNMPRVSAKEILFWEQIASYYMCTIGEVFKAAYTTASLHSEKIKAKKTTELLLEKLSNDKVEYELNPIQLSQAQDTAYTQIIENFKTKPQQAVLLKGVTGSGKTELYINLALEQLAQGNNVLFMVPEISLSKQLEVRLKKTFKNQLLTYHSQETRANKNLIHKILHSAKIPIIILGTRSALLLPYTKLGLIIIDEEHDFSYKQTEPSPRYHARDAALMLALIHGSKILMGSATPSLEALYNTLVGKFSLVELNNKFYGAPSPTIEIIDSIYARKTGQMKGSFSQKLINRIQKEIENNGQVLIFRNRRAYSPLLECTECGHTPLCPHCNVPLSYHKYNNTLSCHHCEYNTTFKQICPKCNNNSFIYKGAGTEKIEEELKNLFPNINIVRYDADISKSKKVQDKILKDFAQGESKILVGTQMISKGFDFKHLSLVVVLQAETIVGIQDFRADEKAIQLLYQLMGRTGRRESKGTIIIQTTNKEHPVFMNLLQDNLLDNNLINNLLQERKEFNFSPYLRMIKIIIKHNNPDKLELISTELKQMLQNIKCKEITGPFQPPIDKIRGEYIKCFYVKFLRDAQLKENKEKLKTTILKIKGISNIILDVDPI